MEVQEHDGADDPRAGLVQPELLVRRLLPVNVVEGVSVFATHDTEQGSQGHRC